MQSCRLIWSWLYWSGRGDCWATEWVGRPETIATTIPGERVSCTRHAQCHAVMYSHDPSAEYWTLSRDMWPQDKGKFTETETWYLWSADDILYNHDDQPSPLYATIRNLPCWFTVMLWSHLKAPVCCSAAVPVNQVVIPRSKILLGRLENSCCLFQAMGNNLRLFDIIYLYLSIFHSNILESRPDNWICHFPTMKMNWIGLNQLGNIQ